MKKPAFITRVRSARKLGQEAMERAEAKAARIAGGVLK